MYYPPSLSTFNMEIVICLKILNHCNNADEAKSHTELLAEVVLSERKCTGEEKTDFSQLSTFLLPQSDAVH